MTRRKRRAALCLAAAALVVLGACGGERRRGPGSQAYLTSVHDQVLRARMARLEALVVGDLPAAMQSEDARREIARVAFRLGEEAGNLPELGDQLGLSSAQRGPYQTITDSLIVSADRLAREARSGTGEAVKARYEEVVDHCVACHNLFRSLPEE